MSILTPFVEPKSTPAPTQSESSPILTSTASLSDSFETAEDSKSISDKVFPVRDPVPAAVYEEWAVLSDRL